MTNTKVQIPNNFKLASHRKDAKYAKKYRFALRSLRLCGVFKLAEMSNLKIH